jgi:hypothetical protein
MDIRKTKYLILQLYERLSNLRNEVGDSKLTARTQRLLMLGLKLVIVADWSKIRPNKKSDNKATLRPKFARRKVLFFSFPFANIRAHTEVQVAQISQKP